MKMNVVVYIGCWPGINDRSKSACIEIGI
jgi:hypothetical protein